MLSLGSLTREAIDDARERLMSKVRVVGLCGCWEFQGAKHEDGYGNIRFAGTVMRAHRVAYIVFVGDVPAGFELDHLCRYRPCCNPMHLEPITREENQRRMQMWQRFLRCVARRTQ